VASFYLEQTLAMPLTASAERALWQRLATCAREHRVRWQDCLVDGEHQRIVYRFEADGLAEARAAARCSELGSAATWWSTVAGTEAGPGFETHSALVDVMAECRLDATLGALVIAREQACAWCLDALRVQPGPVVTSDDGLRMRAFFRAPDAEAVRAAYRHAVVPFDRVVALRRIDPSHAMRRRSAPPSARPPRAPASS
jgi:hypothetical protein